MEEYYKGLRKIRNKAKTCSKLHKPLMFSFFICVLLTVIFPPFGGIAFLVSLLYMFFVMRFFLSKCPRCNNRYFGYAWVFFAVGYISAMKYYRGECRSCKLGMTELPEAEEYRETSHKNEWLK